MMSWHELWNSAGEILQLYIKNTDTVEFNTVNKQMYTD